MVAVAGLDRSGMRAPHAAGMTLMDSTGCPNSSSLSVMLNVNGTPTTSCRLSSLAIGGCG